MAKIFVVDKDFKADVKVFAVDKEFKADLLYAEVDKDFKAKGDTLWFYVDKEFKATSFNNNFSELFKINNGVRPELNTQLHLLVPKKKQVDYKSYWYTIYKKVLEGNSLKLERKQLDALGEINYKEIYQ